MQTAKRAIVLLQSTAPLMNQPYAVPSADGSMQIEWHLPRGCFEMYFEIDGSVSAWCKNASTKVEQEAEGDRAYALLRKWLLEQESNLPPSDYKSAALSAELPSSIGYA